MLIADLIIHNAGQLVTCASNGQPKRRAAMADVGLIENGAVAIKDAKILAVGTSSQLLSDYDSDEIFDANGHAVCPGFVDPHTHIVFAGDRLNEFELKIKGADYLDILASGGGIISTVSQTREASVESLVEQATKRLDKMLACGTTACEIKTGYGLDTATELKMLAVIEQLSSLHQIDIVPTFLAAHAIPSAFKTQPEKYVNLICDTMLSAAWNWFVGSSFYRNTHFYCDVFCENGAFTLAQSTHILETAKSIGYSLKAHVDEFTNLGGSRAAIELGATSIDHLDAISDDEIALLARSNTVGIVTPTVNFNFGSTHFANARQLIDSGCVVALSTDYNPGSAPCPSQPMAMAIACRYQKLLPSEALNAVTINAAFAIGLGNTHGSIEVGKSADLCIVDGTDHRQLANEFGGRSIIKTFKSGREARPS
ncbi:MAG: imidazolonepropionase [Acidobacteriota bacterium]